MCVFIGRWVLSVTSSNVGKECCLFVRCNRASLAADAAADAAAAAVAVAAVFAIASICFKECVCLNVSD